MSSQEGRSDTMYYLHEQILKEYDEQYQDYVRLQEIADGLLEEMLRSASLRVMPLTWRIKERGSLAGKLYRKSDKYRHLSDITDILATSGLPNTAASR